MYSKELVKKLRDIGLNSYEAKIFLALLYKGVASAGELSEITGVPRSRSYDVLESLEKKGFIILKLGKPIKYMALNPEEALERVKNRIKANAQSKIEELEKLKNSNLFKELNALFEDSKNVKEEKIGILKGNAILAYLNSKISNAKKSVLISLTKNSLSWNEKYLSKLLNEAKNKGIEIRIISPNKSENFKDMEQQSGDPALRFYVIDDEAIVMLNDSTAEDAMALVFNSDYFNKSINSIFELMWKTSN